MSILESGSHIVYINDGENIASKVTTKLDEPVNLKTKNKIEKITIPSLNVNNFTSITTTLTLSQGLDRQRIGIVGAKANLICADGRLLATVWNMSFNQQKEKLWLSEVTLTIKVTNVGNITLDSKSVFLVTELVYDEFIGTKGE